ncbi:hypothetical protein RUM43_012243 [Polyplax serrata]|uniref:Uncharacterized protein n=1 Tax=Polyplax serrata TaxID=468196 RepID=A0AAN8P3E7_POLSC
MNKLVSVCKSLPVKQKLSSFKSLPVATRCFSKEGDKDKDAEFEVEDVYKGQTGVLHDKQQSVKEEAFFHKEAQEQMKALKKKVTDKKPDSSESKPKNDS